MNPRFEAGLVYSRPPSEKLWLAIDTHRLLSVGAEAVERVVKPLKRWQWRAIRTLAVEELCDAWGVTCEAFDAIMTRYVPAPVKGKADGRRRRTPRTGAGEHARPRVRPDAEELVWRRDRTARGLLPSKHDRCQSE